MKKSAVVSSLITCLLTIGAASAQSGPELAKAKNCVSCHDVETKKVGPGFKQTAEKYKGDKEAAAKLTTALKEGVKEGKGHPVKVVATDAELKTLISYILSLK